MTISTEFNKGDVVYIIDGNQIIKSTITSVTYVNDDWEFTIFIKKGATMMDSNKSAVRREKNIFKSLDDIRDYYKNILDPITDFEAPKP